MRMISLLSLAFASALAFAAPATAQSTSFAPAVIVNDAIVTRYELDQRVRFLQLLRAPGDPVAEAEKGLIEDRLRRQAAKDIGITLNDEQISAGMAEFAGRANLSTEEFVAAIGQGGVAAETFRDFVAAGLLWREVVRARFNSRISISEADIDRAQSVAAQRGSGPRVLMSEILIPFSPANAIDARELATELGETIRSQAEFARAARAHSAAPSRDQGGQLGWMPLSNLPPQLRQVIAGLANGQVSPPIPLGNAIGIFQLRGLQQGGDIAAGNITVDYAQYLIPGGRSAEAMDKAAKVRGEVDTCDDLYRVARGVPADQLIRETRPLNQVPAHIAAELTSLDDNEISTGLTRGNALVVLMLCKRSATLAEGSAPVIADTSAETLTTTPGEGVPAIDPTLGFGAGPSRAQIREELTNQQLAGYADGFLAELRANAIIRTP